MKTRRPPDSIRIVPRYTDGQEVHEHELKHGWVMNEETLSDDLVQWSVPELDVKISWFRDPGTSVQSFILEGNDRQKIAEEIEAGFDILRPENFEAYIEEVKDWSQARIHHLWAIAMACPDAYDPTGFTVIMQYMRHEDGLTRSVALTAARLTGWQEFIEPVSAMRQDADESVRQDALGVLKELHEYNGLPEPEPVHISEGLTQLDMPTDITEPLRLGLDGWADSVPIRDRKTVYIYDQLPGADATDDEVYKVAKDLSDAWTEKIRTSDRPLQKVGGVYCPICHISGIDLHKLGQPCPKCGRELLRFNWTTF